MSAVARYQYSALTGLDTFRLLRLGRNADGEPLKGELIEHPVAGKAPYQCLSYTWGNAEARREIEIDGQPFPITDTVFAALYWIRAFQRDDDPTSELLWVDSVCINQEDKKERSEQVGNMKKIYSNAELVFVYLGEEADGSDDIPSFYQNIYEVFRQCWKSHDPITNGELVRYPSYHEFQSFGLPDKNHTVWEANRAFLRRPWFLRTWILQEAVLARKLLFICGKWAYEGQGLIRTWHITIGANLRSSTLVPRLE